MVPESPEYLLIGITKMLPTSPYCRLVLTWRGTVTRAALAKGVPQLFTTEGHQENQFRISSFVTVRTSKKSAIKHVRA